MADETIRAFSSDLKEFLSESSKVSAISWHDDADGVSHAEVRPFTAGACAFSIAWSSHEIVIGFDESKRIELGPPSEDSDLAQMIVASIIKGDVWKLATGRSHEFAVRLPNGTWQRTADKSSGSPPEEGSHRYDSYNTA